MRKIFNYSLIIISILSMALFAYSSFRIKARLVNERPIISMDTKEITISIQDDPSAIFSGVVASDPEDGDISESLVVESMSNMIDHSYRKVTIAAFDEDMHVAKATRKVIYSDYRSPRFSLKEPLLAPAATPSKVMEAVSVSDVLDGNLSGQVQFITDTTITSSSVGDYPIHMMVSNSAGDTVDLPVTLTTYSASDKQLAPQIALTEYLLYAKVGETKPNPLSYLDTVTIKSRVFQWNSVGRSFALQPEADGTMRELTEQEKRMTYSDLSITDNVDMSRAGVYEITYRLKDYLDNPAARARLIIVVEE